MALLDHFHPPLHGPRRWEGFHHLWATTIVGQLNLGVLPKEYYAEPNSSIAPARDRFEIHVYKDLGGAELCAAIELVSPANKDRPGSRRTFAAKCAGYLKHGIGLMIVDVVTARNDNLHEELFDVLEAKGRRIAWKSPTGLYAVSYRAVTVRKVPRVEVWPEALALGSVLPVMPLWLSLDLCVPVGLEESYISTCQSLRIST